MRKIHVLTKKTVLAALILSLMSFVFKPTPARASIAENPLFGYPHLLPSPFTLSSGRLIYGVELGYGVTDFFQLSTNLLRDFYKYYNLNAKLSFVDTASFAFALTGGVAFYNLRNFADSNPDTQITQYMPGMVMAFALAEPVALFLGGNLNITSPDPQTSGIETSGFVQGAQVNSDISWSYNPPDKKRRGIGNVLSAGLSYDITYELVGVGISHHWPGFHLGVHYYINADRNPIMPIIAGGGVVDF